MTVSLIYFLNMSFKGREPFGQKQLFAGLCVNQDRKTEHLISYSFSDPTENSTFRSFIDI